MPAAAITRRSARPAPRALLALAILLAAALAGLRAPGRASAQPPPAAPYRLEASWPLPPRDFTVQDLAIAADGTVAVADGKQPRVLIFAPDGSPGGSWKAPCDQQGTHTRLSFDPNKGSFVAVGQCGGRSYVATRSADGQRLTPPAMIAVPLGFLGDVAMTADGLLLAMGAFRAAWLDPVSGLVSRTDTLQEAVATAVRLTALSDGGVALLFPDGHLERFGADGVRQASGAMADSRFTLVDLVDDAAGGLIALAALRGTSGTAIPAAAWPLLVRFDNQLRELATERPPGLVASLPFGPRLGFGATTLHTSAGGLLVGSLQWAHEVHRQRPDGRALRVAAADQRRTLSGASPADMPPPPPPLSRLPVAWVEGQPWLLDGRVTPPELFSLSADGARRLGATELRGPYLDLAAAASDGAWLSRAEGIDRWSEAGGLERLDLPCDCPDGGRLASFQVAGLENLLRSRPRAGRVQVVDAGLRATAGELRLPDPAALWPADLAATPRGEVLTADAATGEVQRWTAGGLLRGAWLETGPGAGPKRIAAADLDEGPDRAAILTADQRLVLRELPEGRWLGEMPVPLPAADGYAEDLALAPDGRIAVSDSGAGQVHLLAPVQGALPTPGGAPSPTPTAADRPCRITRDKVVGPGTVVLGQTAAITLTLAADCGRPGRHVGAELVLVVDSTHDGRSPRDEGIAYFLAQVPEVADALTRWMDRRRHRAGLVAAAADRAAVSLPLGTDPPLIVERLRSLGWPSGATPWVLQLFTDASTMLAGRRPESLGVLILITDASALVARNLDVQQSAKDAIPYAAALRADGIQVFAVLIPSQRYPRPSRERALAWLTEITGSRQRVYEASSGAQVERLADQIYRQVRDLAGASLAGSLTLHDEMAPDIALLPGTAGGGPLEGPDWLIWRRGLLPTSGITLSYRIRPQKLGFLPTNRFAVADYTDVDGQRRSVTFPVPRIQVIAPSPTPTSPPTSTPYVTSPPRSTPRPRPLYLPLLSLRHCLAQAAAVDVVLVLDSSQSMLEVGRGGRSKLDAAQEAVRVFLDLLLLPADRAALVAFNGEATVLQGLTGSRSQLEAGLGRLKVGSGTRIHLGLAQARGLLPPRRPARRSAILLLTDGRSDPDPATLAIAQARAAQAEGAVLVAVGLGADIDRAALEQMASPGQFFLAPDAEDLAALYRRLAAAMPCLP